ncbi:MULTISPECIES: Arc family DNA-binding protein [Acinetobacter calcoaceticus/baumannii complex]|uniref:Arc-like DNA binding domain-containing protein n=1 Tax=Acinetobacter pittii ANC 4050 TaxID=1217691 RepID=R8YIC2_ACIPI|nr:MULTISPECIES: Arc family DNA-binding protein [Acinetobacter calcoaceticus/baumannii complex]EOQ68836.1 hypothetical protein F931_01554 [Acinetobacter pittii ANC 4050]RSO39158.1 Arc family DNA-binding protein [Acinetobacter lactucae]
MADIQFNLRIPEELKEKIKEAAIDSGRSINAEAQTRLEQTFFDEKSKKEGIAEINNMFKTLIDENKALKEQNELYNAKMLKLLDSLIDDLKKTK